MIRKVLLLFLVLALSLGGFGCSRDSDFPKETDQASVQGGEGEAGEDGAALSPAAGGSGAAGGGGAMQAGQSPGDQEDPAVSSTPNPRQTPSPDDPDFQEEKDASKDQTAKESAPPSSSPEATVKPEAPSLNYSERAKDTILAVTGQGVDRDYFFSLKDLKSLSAGYFEGDYFSKGKTPQEMTNSYKGIKLGYLLGSVVSLGGSAKSIRAVASDNFVISRPVKDLSAAFINEKDENAVLYMILAWEEDSSPIDLKLVMGQAIKGEYNRQYWARGVTTIEVR